MEKLSITDTEQKITLENNKSDAFAVSVKSILGILPFGSLISEIVTNVIPNQRTERVVLFVEILNDKLSYLEKEIVEQKTKTQEFTDLLQDGFIQASRALTKERLEYITSLLKNSLTDEELEHIEKKKLLSILGELNDAEIIWLQSFLPLQYVSDEFLEKHEKVLTISPLYEDCSISEEDKQAVQKSYKQKLIQLGLLREIYHQYGRDEFPEFDGETGRIKASDYQVSTLGYSLLRIIDLQPKEN